MSNSFKDIFTSLSQVEQGERISHAIRHCDIIGVIQGLNLYSGPKNHFLVALADTLMDETEEKLTPAAAFKREYHNGQVMRVAEQHASKGFDFDSLRQKILIATGKETRANHVTWAKNNAEERWAEEVSEGLSIVAEAVPAQELQMGVFEHHAVKEKIALDM